MGAAPAAPPADPAKAQYEAAADLLKTQHYDAAQQGFLAFLQKNPHSRLIAPATYHLGESYYYQSRHREAAEQFLKIATGFLEKFGGARRDGQARRFAQRPWREGTGLRLLLRLPRKYPNASAADKTAAAREAKRPLAEPTGRKGEVGAVRVKKTPQDNKSLDPARLFAGSELVAGLVLAVSGGPDSLALMMLAAKWRENGGADSLSVATVDHGLREGSKAEAEQVGEWAAALGLPHAILPWRGEKPARAIQEKAREARYALLFAHAKALGAEAVATAHHADDQWETLLFRLARGSGWPASPAWRAIRSFRRETHSPVARPAQAGAGRPLPCAGLRLFRRSVQCPSRFRPLPPSRHGRAFARPGLRPRKGGKAGRTGAKNRCGDRLGGEGNFSPRCSSRKNIYDLSALEEAPLELLERFLSIALTRAAGAAPQRLDRLEALAEKVGKALKNEIRSSAPTWAGASWCLTRNKEARSQAGKPTQSGLQAKA